MAQERFFFARAARVHPRYRTPHWALLYTLGWSSLLVVSGTFDLLTDLVIFATFLFYGLVAVAVLKRQASGTNQGLPLPANRAAALCPDLAGQHRRDATKAIGDRRRIDVNELAILCILQPARKSKVAQL